MLARPTREGAQAPAGRRIGQLAGAGVDEAGVDLQERRARRRTGVVASTSTPVV